MVKSYTQTTYETCLAVSLLQVVNTIKPIKISQKLELECINHSMKFNKEDFVIGHLDFIAKKFDIGILRIIDNKHFYDYITKIKSSKKIENKINKITLSLLDYYLNKDYEPICYIDAYYLFKVYHYPHWITVTGRKKDSYVIFDTWEGKSKVIDSNSLKKMIISLRNHLKFCPQIILIKS